MIGYMIYVDSFNSDLTNDLIKDIIISMKRDHVTPYCFDTPSYMARSPVEATAAMAIAETDSWIGFLEIYDAGSKTDVEKLAKLKTRMIEYQVFHHAIAEVNSLGHIDREWHLEFYDEATFEFVNYKSNHKLTDLPRGLTREAYREIIRAYLIGSEHGRQDADCAYQCVFSG